MLIVGMNLDAVERVLSTEGVERFGWTSSVFGVYIMTCTLTEAARRILESDEELAVIESERDFWTRPRVCRDLT